MVLFGLDARRGLLPRLGFAKEPHPQGVGSSLYRGHGALLHSTGLWVAGVYYLRPEEAFYRAPLPLLPPEEGRPEDRLPLREALEALRSFVLWYEGEVRRLTGEDREAYLCHLPPLARGAVSAWREWLEAS
jgi:hypothetical protein